MRRRVFNTGVAVAAFLAIRYFAIDWWWVMGAGLVLVFAAELLGALAEPKDENDET
jgi:hypothetical protein